MAVKKAKAPPVIEEAEPSERDVEHLRKIKHDSMLGRAHPMVFYNVVDATCELLEHLGRPKLARVLKDL